MDKPVEEMTREEVAAELARVRAAKVETNGNGAASEEDLAAEWARSQAAAAGIPQAAETSTKVDGDEWPHLTIEHAGMTLQVRKPDESALIAISMTGTPGILPQTQMRIFTKFLMNHMSPDSFVQVIEAMTTPESGVSIQSIIEKMTKL